LPLPRKGKRLQQVSQILRKCHGSVLKDWKIVNAIATPDIECARTYFEVVDKTSYQPCNSCFSFIISKSTDLGRLR
jgi:hypothetical protein